MFDIGSQSIHTTWRNSKRKFIQFYLVGVTYRNLFHGRNFLSFLVMNYTEFNKYIRKRALQKYCNREEVRAVQSCYADRFSQTVSAFVQG